MLRLFCLVFIPLLSFGFPIQPLPTHYHALSTLQNRNSINLYYEKVVKTFADGDAKALTNLFAKNITQPMKISEIFAWAKDFFASNGPSTFVVENLVSERIDTESAVAVLTYHVNTLDNKGDFSGIERDHLLKIDGEWVISAWDKVE